MIARCMKKIGLKRKQINKTKTHEKLKAMSKVDNNTKQDKSRKHRMNFSGS